MEQNKSKLGNKGMSQQIQLELDQEGWRMALWALPFLDNWGRFRPSSDGQGVIKTGAKDDLSKALTMGGFRQSERDNRRYTQTEAALRPKVFSGQPADLPLIRAIPDENFYLATSGLLSLFGDRLIIRLDFDDRAGLQKHKGSEAGGFLILPLGVEHHGTGASNRVDGHAMTRLEPRRSAGRATSHQGGHHHHNPQKIQQPTQLTIRHDQGSRPNNFPKVPSRF